MIICLFFTRILQLLLYRSTDIHVYTIVLIIVYRQINLSLSLSPSYIHATYIPSGQNSQLTAPSAGFVRLKEGGVSTMKT